MSDPYAVLGVTRRVSDAELRAAYRRAVQLHHPDHNGGSPESARRFEEVQEAYAAIRAQRGDGRPSTPAPDLDARLAAMEAELAAARDARENARRAARAAAEAATAGAAPARHDRPGRASDEELGYVTSEDSFGAIFADAAADVFDDLAARLRGERKRREQ